MTRREAERIMWGELCPECGNEDRETIADNGDPRPWDRGYLCEKCETQWEADHPAQRDRDLWDLFEAVFGVTVTENGVLGIPRDED